MEEDEEDSDNETPQITISYKNKRERIDAFKVNLSDASTALVLPLLWEINLNPFILRVPGFAERQKSPINSCVASSNEAHSKGPPFQRFGSSQ